MMRQWWHYMSGIEWSILLVTKDDAMLQKIKKSNRYSTCHDTTSRWSQLGYWEECYCQCQWHMSSRSSFELFIVSSLKLFYSILTSYSGHVDESYLSKTITRAMQGGKKPEEMEICLSLNCVCNCWKCPDYWMNRFVMLTVSACGRRRRQALSWW